MNRLPWWGWGGVAVLAAGLAVLIADVPGLNTAWFLFAWVGALLVMDGLIEVAGGVAFLRGRRRELGAMALWSIPFWCLFEAYNVRLQTWWYVFVPSSDAGQGLLAAAAFATVLPACFIPAELLATLGCFDSVRWRPVPMTRRARRAVGLFGISCLIAPLLWPTHAHPLVWGATFGLPALAVFALTGPGQIHHGAPSLLRDLEAGTPGRWLQLLAGGLIAGGLWEGLNWPARARWIYTVPGLEDLKLFEMPVLGFLGFPALAVEAFAGYGLVCLLLRGGRHWTRSDAANAARRPGRRGQVGAMAAILVFSALCSAITMEPQLIAARPLLEESPHLPGDLPDRLRAAGWGTPERLDRAVRTLGVEVVARAAGVAPQIVTAAADHAGLAVHKGMGSENATLLQAVGVRHPGQLAGRRAAVLHSGLVIESARARIRPPPLAVVAVWIRSAPATGQSPHR